MKILVICLRPFLGEILFITPALHALRRAYPCATVEVLVERKFHEVVLHNPHLDKVIAMDKRGRDAGPRGHLRIIGDLRHARYDWVINLNGSERATLIAAFSGARKTQGLAAGWPFSLLYPNVKHRNDVHLADSYLYALEEIGIPVPVRDGLEMYVNQETRDMVESIWSGSGLRESGIIGIHPGAGGAEKRWTVEGIARLTDMLHADGRQVALFGARGDSSLAGQIVGLTSTNPIVLTGRLNILELAAAIGKCSVFVSADSGPMHVAASQQVPTVALFGPTNPVRHGPYKVRHSVVRAADGRMSSITPEQVYEAIHDLFPANPEGG